MPEQVHMTMLRAMRTVCVVIELRAVPDVNHVVDRIVVELDHRLAADPTLDQRTRFAGHFRKRRQPSARHVKRGGQFAIAEATPVSLQ